MTKNNLLLFALTAVLLTVATGCAKLNANNTTIPKPEISQEEDDKIGEIIKKDQKSLEENMELFAIKELGITFNIPAIYKDDLLYSIETDGRGGLKALMYSKSMKQKGDACSRPGSLGWISKNRTIYDAHGTERDFNSAFDVKIGDEYITINSTGDVCYGNDKELEKEYAGRAAALRQAVSTIEGTGESMVEDLGVKTSD